MFVPLTLGEVLLLTVFGILAISIELCVYKKERNIRKILIRFLARENMVRLKYLLTVEVDRKLSDNELTDSSFDGPKVCEA